jgi:hypothetical protein
VCHSSRPERACRRLTCLCVCVLFWRTHCAARHVRQHQAHQQPWNGICVPSKQGAGSRSC